MAKVPNGVKTFPKISIAWVGRTNVTDDRQTDRQTTDGRTTTYSEPELEFTFAKNGGIDTKCAWHGVTAMWETNIKRKYGIPTLLRASQTAGHASLSRNLLLSRDRWRSQWWLRNHVSPCQLCGGGVWRTRSHVLVIQTMGLRGLLCACSWVTITNWILVANTGKLNFDF